MGERSDDESEGARGRTERAKRTARLNCPSPFRNKIRHSMIEKSRRESAGFIFTKVANVNGSTHKFPPKVYDKPKKVLT
jgi:hypothetical protein